LGRITRPRVRHALATPEHAPMLGPTRAMPHQPRTHARAREYKSNPGLNRTPPLTPNPARAQVHRRSPSARRASDRLSLGHRRTATPALLHPI
jgi:hypothetical protein